VEVRVLSWAPIVNEGPQQCGPSSFSSLIKVRKAAQQGGLRLFRV
jgi:hypothetical protein